MHPGFWFVLGALLMQRVAELVTNKRNIERMKADGGHVVRDDGFGLLVVTQSAFFVLASAEALLSPLAGVGWWTIPGLAVFVVGELLRGWSIAHLAGRYTVRIVVLPQAPLVMGGPYRLLRHPIYVGVTLVLAGVPLAFGLWGTAAVVALLNAVALMRRIRREDAALAPLRRASDA